MKQALATFGLMKLDVGTCKLSTRLARTPPPAVLKQQPSGMYVTSSAVYVFFSLIQVLLSLIQVRQT